MQTSGQGINQYIITFCIWLKNYNFHRSVSDECWAAAENKNIEIYGSDSEYHYLWGDAQVDSYCCNLMLDAEFRITQLYRHEFYTGRCHENYNYDTFYNWHVPSVPDAANKWGFVKTFMCSEINLTCLDKQIKLFHQITPNMVLGQWF